MNNYRAFLRDESGATAIEYGLIAAMISVLVVSGASLAGVELSGLYTDVGDCINDARNDRLC